MYCRLATLLLLASSTATFADDQSRFKATEVVPGITMIEGADGFIGGNMAVLAGDEYVAMIDDGLEPIAPALQAYAIDIAGRPINFMINTHVHGDHTGGNAHFAADGTIVFAHDNIRKRLLADPAPAGGASGLPVVTFGKGVTFHLNGIEARVIHLPAAHTDGDAIIYFPHANVIHTGDIFFNKLFPFIDLDNGGSVEGYIKAQKKIYELADDDTQIIPGHGALTNRAELKENLDVLIDSFSRIKKLAEAGRSADDIRNANPLADYHDTYNWGFITTERMTNTLIRSVMGE